MCVGFALSCGGSLAKSMRSVFHIFALIGLLFARWLALPALVSAEQGGPVLDNRFILETVKSVGDTIHEQYFDVNVAADVKRVLKLRLAEGRYASATTHETVASMLTEDLFELTHDKHLAVAVARNKPTGAAAGNEADDSRTTIARRTNFGVQRVEILAGNVGYLNLTAFYRPDEARDAISAAMRTLRHADALILDVRNHGGGSPDTAALVASYFFTEKRMPLFEIVPRSGKKRVYETESSDLPERNGTRSMYVLTSARTFSAGEGIAFLLQERKRAEVIGETTAGAANPGRPYRVNDHFEVTVPNGKLRTAVGGTNWEGTGVVPEAKVAAAEALRTAHLRALGRLIQQTKAGTWRDDLQRQLHVLQSAS